MLLSVEGIHVNKGTDEKATPLYIACQNGYLKTVKLLLAVAGIQVNQADDEEVTPLFMASQRGHSKVVEMLLSVEGIQVNQACDTEATPLYIASYDGHSKVVKLLLAVAGIQVNQADNEELTPLWMASVVSKEGSAPTMQMSKLNVAPASNSNSLPTAAADATIVVYEDVLYVYGGCAVTAGNQKCAAQVRSIPLASLMAKDSTELVSWSSPTTGNAVVGQAIGGAGFIHASTTMASSFVVLGGCANGEVTCTVQRQDVNLKGECAGA